MEVLPTNMENMNSREYLEKVKYCLFLTRRTKILENLRHLPHAPSVQMHHVPNDLFSDDDDEEDEDKDVRISRIYLD